LADSIEFLVCELTRAPVEDQQTGGVARFDRRLGNAFGGEVVIVIGQFYRHGELIQRSSDWVSVHQVIRNLEKFPDYLIPDH
jgi:hypothetical protein